MSGGFWAGSVPPWASVILVLVCGLVFVLGLAAGESMGRRHELEDRAEEEGERAARQFRRMRQPELRERKTSTAAFLDPPELHHEPPLILTMRDGPGDPASIRALAHSMLYGGKEEAIEPPHWHGPDWACDGMCPQPGWSEHVDQALDVANGDPITTGEIRAITEDMDVFLGRLLGEHPVPWPDGQQ